MDALHDARFFYVDETEKVKVSLTITLTNVITEELLSSAFLLILSFSFSPLWGSRSRFP